MKLLRMTQGVGGPLPLWTSAVVLPTMGDLSVITSKGGMCDSALPLGQGLEWAGWERCGQEDARWHSASLLDSGQPHSSPALRPDPFLDLISLTEN